MAKDLFGNRVPEKKPKYHRTLERFDKRTFSDRLKRLQWLQTVYPKGYGFLMPPETMFIFREAKMSFINGEHISTLLLANSFVEHWLSSNIAHGENSKLANSGLAKLVQHCRQNKLINAKVLDRIDELREIRNPFVHLKPAEHKKRIMWRTIDKKTNYSVLLEEDAKRALTLMYNISVTQSQ